MDLLTLSLALLLVSFLLIYRFFTSKFNYFTKRGIPGPRPIPIFGTCWGSWNRILGEKDLADMKKYGKIYGTFDGRIPHLMISDPELTRRILVRDFNHFRNRWIRSEGEFVRKNLVTIRDDEWKKIRYIVASSFTSAKIKKVLPIMKTKIVELVKHFKTMSSPEKVDLQKEFTGYLLGMIADVGFGITIDTLKNPDHPLVYHAKKMFAADGSDSIMDVIPFIFSEYVDMDPIFFPEESRKYFNKLCYQIIKDRRNLPPRGDFVDLLLEAADEERKNASSSEDIVMNDETLAAQIFVFLIAGFVTTNLTLSFTAYEMARNPEMQERLYEEVTSKCKELKDGITIDSLSEFTYLEMFLNEILRLYPSDFRVERICTEDYDLDGIKIDRGVYVSIPTYAIHRSEEFYPDPMKFDPERFSPETKSSRNAYTYLPFGQGPRNCLGMRFAYIVMKLTLVELIKGFRFKRTKDTIEPLEYLHGTALMLFPKPFFVGQEQRK